MAVKRRSTRSRPISRKSVSRTSVRSKITPIGFPSEIRTRKNLKYVLVPVDTVRGVAHKRLQDQKRVAQMDSDMLKSLEALVIAAKKAKRGTLTAEAELALRAAEW